MKTIGQAGENIIVTEALAPNGDGSPAVRSWSFVTLADAARQRAEFESALSAAQKSALTAAAGAKR